MSTSTFDSSLKGKLVTVDADSSNRIYTKPQIASRTDEFVVGPATAGTATGNVYTENTVRFVELVRVKSVMLYGIPVVSTVYMLLDQITLVTNPKYTPETTPVSKKKDSLDEPDTTDYDHTTDPDVSTTPGEGRVPVTAEDGKTVYVLVKQKDESTPTSEAAKTNKWLTYGLYGVIGLGAITLVVILVLSLRKPKTQVPRPVKS